MGAFGGIAGRLALAGLIGLSVGSFLPGFAFLLLRPFYRNPLPYSQLLERHVELPGALPVTQFSILKVPKLPSALWHRV